MFYIKKTGDYLFISFRRETICDALAQTEWRNFVSKFFSSPQMHARWQHQGGGGCTLLLFDAESKSVVKIFPFTKRSGLRIFWGRGGGGLHTFTFWCWVQICGQKFFPLPSALDLEMGSFGNYSLTVAVNVSFCLVVHVLSRSIALCRKRWQEHFESLT